VLVEFRVLTTIQFVHDQFPDGVAAGGAVLIVTMATVGHAEVESVWPQRDVLKWSGDGRIVKEGLLFHHGELVVTSHAQVGSAHTYDRVVGDVGEFVDDETSSGHFFSPVIHRSFGPESFVVVVRDGMYGDFVSLSVDLLNGGVVAVLMGNVESGLDVATVGVFASAVEHEVVQVDVVVVDGVIEGDHNHLWDLFEVQVGWDSGSVFRAEAVGQCAAVRVAYGSTVGIRFQRARVFIGAVATIGHAVTEGKLVKTGTVVAGQLTLLTQRFICAQNWLQFTLLLFLFAVLDG